MGFCSDEAYERFLRICPAWEHDFIDSGLTLVKYWLDVDKDEQTRRFVSRINDPRKTWKLSPMDLESHRRWYDYSRARDAMLAATHTPKSPWHIIDGNDKRRARLTCISHFLSLIPFEKTKDENVKLPKRQDADGYVAADHEHLKVKSRY
jgi:polyphosphate kinase 2 (PPK2 family)